MFKPTTPHFPGQKDVFSTDPDASKNGIKRNSHPLFVPVVSRSEISNNKTIPIQHPTYTQPPKNTDQLYVFPELPEPASWKGWKLILEEHPNNQYVPTLKYMPVISRSQSFYEDTTMEDSSNKNSFIGTSSFQNVFRNEQPSSSTSMLIDSDQHPLSSNNSSLFNQRNNININNNNNNNNNTHNLISGQQESGYKNSMNYVMSSPKLKPFFTRDTRPKDTRRSFIDCVQDPRSSANMSFEYTEQTNSDDSYDPWSQIGDKRQIKETKTTDRRVLPKTDSNESTEMFTLPSHPTTKKNSSEVTTENGLGPQSMFSSFMPMSDKSSVKTRDPTLVKVYGYPKDLYSKVLNEFLKCGEVESHSQEGSVLFIRYKTSEAASQALRHHGDIMFDSCVIGAVPAEQAIDTKETEIEQPTTNQVAETTVTEPKVIETIDNSISSNVSHSGIQIHPPGPIEKAKDLLLTW